MMTAQSSLLSGRHSPECRGYPARSRFKRRKAILSASARVYAFLHDCLRQVFMHHHLWQQVLPHHRSGRKSFPQSEYRARQKVKPNFDDLLYTRHSLGSKSYASSRILFKRSKRNKIPRINLKELSLGLLEGEFGKRLFDIVFSLLVLVLFSPVYFLLVLLIALNSEGSIFYIQERIGKDFKPFNCIKFRTMVNNADRVLEEILEDSPHIRQEFEANFKLKKDPRITRIGHFLRITSLDEFPQFWNVLKGDMSVVGPRPLVAEELHKYGCHIDTILTIRPGITGLWQVSGRNDIPYPKRVQIDMYYVRFRDFWLDLWIILKTIGVMMNTKNNGAY